MTPVELDRADLLADSELAGFALCAALSRWADGWLAELFDAAAALGSDHGFALVAVGGYGRGELSPQSDLDVLLLHGPKRDPAVVTAVAEAIWYPIWDRGVKLGHAVRSVPEAVSLADGDLDTATALLDSRHIAGDPQLSANLSSAAVERWRRAGRKRLTELSRTVVERHERTGEVAFLLEPDLKEGRGGLRDVHALRWAQAAGAGGVEGHAAELAVHYETLLAVRVELHRRTGRPGDRLLLEEQDAVAAALGHADADDTMRRVATAARAIAWRSDESWRVIDAELGRSFGRRSPKDQPVATGIVQRGDRLALTDSADLTNPMLVLDVAAAAAASGVIIDRSALPMLALLPPLPTPWPREARQRFAELLLAGRDAIEVIESLDTHGIWVQILPEWAAVQCKPQRNAYHRFTVDRHLLEAAANAASLTDRVDRPDLLVVGALLHDIGKGRPGDHTEVGIEMVDVIGRRMGFPDEDVEDLVQMVRHHLLLPDVATRRDLADDGTISLVAEAAGSLRVLRLLDGLTEADSLATGPAAWGDWKAGLVRELVARTAHVLGGGAVGDLQVDFPTTAHRALMAAGRRSLAVDGDVLTVVDADRHGVFSKVAGVLALNGATVLAASAHSDAGAAVAEFRVAVAAGREIPWPRITTDLDRALDGRLAVSARLADRIGAYRRARPRTAVPAANRVEIDNDVSAAATVVEVHTEDRMGVLYRVTAAIAELGLDIRRARIQTVGERVVDAFYLLDPHGRKLTDPHALDAVRVAILHALDTAP